MNEQFTISGFEPAYLQECNFLDSIFPKLEADIENCGGDPKFLSYKVTQKESQSGGYTAVYVSRLTAFRLKIRGKQHYISLPTLFSDLIPEEFPTKKIKSEKYIRIVVDQLHPIESYTSFLSTVVKESLNRYPKEWDCCSRYLECSNEKKCIHPDKEFALACGYKKILNSGRVFYGTNRNID